MASALDKILDEIVVFYNPDGTAFSNNPAWQNDAVREAWAARNAGDLEDKDVDGDKDDDEDDGDEVEDYASWTNDDLRAELAERSLSVDGKKAELVKRLEDDDAAKEA